MPESGLIKPRPEKNWNVSARNQERSIKPHDLVAVQLIAKLPVSIPSGLRAINCKDYAVSPLCKSWERTEDKQPESTAAVGAAILSSAGHFTGCRAQPQR
jgi:hypothetical protein